MHVVYQEVMSPVWLELGEWCRRGVEDETENMDGGLIGEEGGGVGVLGCHRVGQDRAGC